jgi:hypothetical protein
MEKGRIFSEFGNLATYLIPRKDIPPIPEHIRKYFGFTIEKKE